MSLLTSSSDPSVEFSFFSMTVVVLGSRWFEAVENIFPLPALPLGVPEKLSSGALFDILGLKFIEEVELIETLDIDLFRFIIRPV